MVKKLVALWAITILTVIAVAMGQPQSPCSCSMMREDPFGFNVRIESLHPTCMIAKELADLESLLQVGKRLAHDALSTFTYEPSVQTSLQNLLAALNKFSERVKQLKRQATRACPPWYLQW